MTNKIFIQYKRVRKTNLYREPIEMPNKVESLRCTSILGAYRILSKRNKQNIQYAKYYDATGKSKRLKVKRYNYEMAKKEFDFSKNPQQ